VVLVGLSIDAQKIYFYYGLVGKFGPNSDKNEMSWSELDAFFPFIVFIYGAFLTLVLESKYLDKLGREYFSQLHLYIKSHKALAWICFYVGGFWSLQNLLF
jgi:hypothetical protein